MLPSTAIVRMDLTWTFEEFSLAMSRQGFIAPQVFRPRLVGIQAANVGKLTLEALLQTEDDSRQAGGGYKRSDAEWTTFSYATEEHGREAVLDDRHLAIFRDVIDAESVLTARAADIVLRNYEIAAAAALYDTATWTGAGLTTAITEEWDDATNAVPLKDIEAARRKVRDACGLKANALVCNSYQLWNLLHADSVVALLKYWGGDDPKTLNQRTLSALTQLDHIIVADGQKNAANSDPLTASLSQLWSDEYVMVCRVAESEDPSEPCVGRTFMFSEENAGTGTDEELALISEEYREEGVRGSVLRVRNDRAIKIMYAEAGHLLSNATT